MLDLAGRTAIPGFVESHNHPTFFGMTLAAAVDAGTPPNDTITDVIAFAATRPSHVNLDQIVVKPRAQFDGTTVLRDEDENAG